jgi:phosphomannomutase
MNTEYRNIYIDFLRKHCDLKKSLTVVCDSSNGATSFIVPALINIPNLKIISINDTPDGNFPAHGPNPLAKGALEQLGNKVVELKADLGVAFDADGDRAFFVDNTGQALASFTIAALLFTQGSGPYIADETVYKSLQHMNLFAEGQLIPSKVGSFFVKERLKEAQGTIAAEFSGHYYFKDFFNADSGLFTMITVLNMISRLPLTLHQFAAQLPAQCVYNNDIVIGERLWQNVETTIRTFASDKNMLLETREGLTLDNGSEWINIRPSNTEPLLRVIAGGREESAVKNLVEALRAAIIR